jgi:hypothetical protein
MDEEAWIYYRISSRVLYQIQTPCFDCLPIRQNREGINYFLAILYMHMDFWLTEWRTTVPRYWRLVNCHSDSICKLPLRRDNQNVPWMSYLERLWSYPSWIQKEPVAWCQCTATMNSTRVHTAKWFRVLREISAWNRTSPLHFRHLVIPFRHLWLVDRESVTVTVHGSRSVIWGCKWFHLIFDWEGQRLVSKLYSSAGRGHYVKWWQSFMKIHWCCQQSSGMGGKSSC